MVRITDFKERVSAKGTFNVLVLQGDLEFMVSKQTGKMYATAQTCTISSTFDARTCESLIGKTMKGSIVKVDCDEYEFTVPETGEVLNLSHRYEYSPVEKGEMESVVMDKPTYAMA
jgi:GTP:adenosylcobinamide-phosphate guanylyltransferase